MLSRNKDHLLLFKITIYSVLLVLLMLIPVLRVASYGPIEQVIEVWLKRGLEGDAEDHKLLRTEPELELGFADCTSLFFPWHYVLQS